MAARRRPSWVSLGADAFSQGDASITLNTSTRQSAKFFRVECERTWQQRILRAERIAWTATVRSLMNIIHVPNDAEASTGVLPPLLQRYSMTPPQNDDVDTDELLPMTIIVPPPSCHLDRQGLAEAVWDYHHHHQVRCCSLFLPTLLPTLRATLQLLVRQCFRRVANYENDRRTAFQLQAARYFRKHFKNRGASMRRMILWWAARTSAFDSVVIILKDAGGFAQSKVWNEFISLLQELRQEDGLPISLVVVGNVSVQRGLRLRIRHVQPSRPIWMQTFWHDLILTSSSSSSLNSSQVLPFPLLCTNRLEQLVPDYSLGHKSFARVGEDLLSHATAFYSHHPSQLVWDALELNPLFLAWLATHGTAKKWLSTKPGPNKYTALETCLKHQTKLKWWWMWQAKLLPILMTNNENENERVAIDDSLFPLLLQSLAQLYYSSTTTGETETENNGLITVPTLPEELERYLDRAGIRKRNESGSNAFFLPPSPEQIQAKTLLYELILFIGHAINHKKGEEALKDSTSTTAISELTPEEEKDGILRMVFELFTLCNKTMESLLDEWNNANPLSKTCQQSKRKGELENAQSNVLERYEHHRQLLLEGLISPARELYGLMQNRWSISREEWFYNFGGSPVDFVRGVWTLVLAGLVQGKSKKGGKNGTMVYYEKVSVVWC